MKNLIMLSMLMTLVACNGAGGSGSPDAAEGEPVAHTDLVIEYNSYGVFQNTGTSMDLMGTYDEQRSFVIPETLDLVQDSNASVQLNDTARIIFVQSRCDYRWNGSVFLFNNCTGVLTGSQFGDVVHLYDIRSVSNPQMNGTIQMGVIRPSASNHTGTIVIQANIQ